ncbi:MAG: Hint domain-containing protein, partial [Pseudomonadota bacterium]
MPNGGFVSFYEFNDFLITGDDAREVNPLANGPLSARTGLDITFTLPPGSAGLQMIEVRDNDPRFEDDFQESRRLGPCNQSVVDDVFIDGGRTQIAEAGDFLEVEFTILVEDPDGNQARLFFAAFTTSSAGDDAGSLTMVFSDQMLVPGVEYSFVRTQDGGGVRYSALVNCFAAGTLIETPAGPRAVETLAVGDLVRTADGRDVALRWTGTQHLGPEELARQPALRPVRIAAGAFGPGRPARDLVVSPQHRIVVDHWRVATFFGHDAVLAPMRSCSPKGSRARAFSSATWRSMPWAQRRGRRSSRSSRSCGAGPRRWRRPFRSCAASRARCSPKRCAEGPARGPGRPHSLSVCNGAQLTCATRRPLAVSFVEEPPSQTGESPMPITVGQDTNSTRKTLEVGGKSYAYYSIAAAEAAGLGDFSKLPAVLKVVLENLLRFEDGKTVSTDDIRAFADWAAAGGKNPREIAYRPARVLMQDFTGVPAVVDLAAMRDAMVALGGDPEKINPLSPVDLVIDHSVMVDEFGNPRACQMNVDREYER